MTDKKYEELLKCAKALTSGIDNCQTHAISASNIREWREFKALKACLPPPPPSREEIADKLEACFGTDSTDSTDSEEGCYKYIKCAIEELRKDV